MPKSSYWHLEGFLKEPSVLHPEDVRILAFLVEAVANYGKKKTVTQASVLELLVRLGPLQPAELSLLLGHGVQGTGKVKTTLRRLADRGVVLWDETEECS